MDKTAIIHCPLGKASFDAEKLTENLRALMDAIVSQTRRREGHLPALRRDFEHDVTGIKLNPLRF